MTHKLLKITQDCVIWTLSPFFGYTVCLSPSQIHHTCAPATPSTRNALPQVVFIEPTYHSGLSANPRHILREACCRDPYKTSALLPASLSYLLERDKGCDSLSHPFLTFLRYPPRPPNQNSCTFAELPLMSLICTNLGTSSPWYNR